MIAKRYLTPLAVLMVWLLSAPAMAAPKIRGDINGDSKVTIADVTAMIAIKEGKDNAKPYKFDHTAADMNADGTVDEKDVRLLVKLILSPKVDAEGNFVIGDTAEDEVHDEEIDGDDAWVKRRRDN